MHVLMSYQAASSNSLLCATLICNTTYLHAAALTPTLAGAGSCRCTIAPCFLAEEGVNECQAHCEMQPASCLRASTGGGSARQALDTGPGGAGSNSYRGCTGCGAPPEQAGTPGNKQT